MEPPPQIYEMFQKFSLAVKAKTYELIVKDDNQDFAIASAFVDADTSLLDSTDEFIPDQKMVVIKPDRNHGPDPDAHLTQTCPPGHCTGVHGGLNIKAAKPLGHRKFQPLHTLRGFINKLRGDRIRRNTIREDRIKEDYERGRQMAPSTYNLRRLLEYRSKKERLEVFPEQGRLVLTVTDYILKLCSEDDKIIASIECLDDSAKLCWVTVVTH
ncbi:protein of unknown function-containing protein [Forsythia ovata]|uniref:Uncharacterized protein n=1 Tax=Forsythia ovata TaxID=205694 RepID=A0ABD1WXE8_9LAMI